MWSFYDFHDVPHLHRVLKGKKKRWMISKSTYKFCKVNDSEEATKPSNEINDLNTWSLEANDTQAVGKIFYTCIRHGSYKGAGLKNSEDGIFVSYFIPSLRTADVFPVVASLPGETKAAGYFIPNRQNAVEVLKQRFVTCSESNATAFLFSRLLPTAWCLTWMT